MISFWRYNLSDILDFNTVCLNWIYKIPVCAKLKQGGKNCNVSCADSEIIFNCLKKSR